MPFIANCLPKLSAKIKIVQNNVLTKNRCDLKLKMTVNRKTCAYCLEEKSDKSSSRCNNVLLLPGDILKTIRLEKASDNVFGVFLSYHKTDG